MIYIDDKGHLISDESEKELHFFAFQMGLKREQYIRGRLPRYNCQSQEMIENILIMGARLITTRELVLKLRVLREKLHPKDLDENGIRIYQREKELTRQ